MSSTIPTTTLPDGKKIPLIAFGTGTAWYKSSPNDAPDRALIDIIKTAIKLGYTHLDGAEIYNTEVELGIAIRESGVPREKLFVTTKVDNGVDDIPTALRKSLERLQLDYVDLYLIHQPFFAYHPDNPTHSSSPTAALQNTWAAMETLQSSSLTRSIGVSNYLPQHLDILLQTAKTPPAMNQIEHHPYLQRSNLLTYLREKNIAVAAYSPLAPLTASKNGPVDPVVQRLARKYGVSEAVVLLRWCVDRDVVAVTTSAKEDRLRDYLRVGDLRLTAEEVEEITTKAAGRRYRAYFRRRFGDEDFE
ncbi:MAG: hypothetical protein M1817_003652 [Caeruleum heppii]|nr:MAG: hypothetical protein M1817_003652 [Caeruleum heppii]